MAISILVTLDNDYNSEEIKTIIDTLKMVKTVLSADVIESISNLGEFSIRLQVQREFREKIWKALE